MENKIVFIVATQYDNVGDLLINKCLIDSLSKHSNVYLDTKNVPNSFKKLLLAGTQNVNELSSITPYSFKGIGFIHLLFSSIRITHLFKSPGPFGSNGNKKVFFKNMMIGFIFYLFKLKLVKSYLVGNDVLFKSRLDKFALYFFSKNTTKILCRSHSNVVSLQKAGIKNVDYIPDMCFAHSANAVDSMNDDLICISFRDLKDEIYHQKIVDAIQNILSYNDMSITFFYQVDHDYTYNKGDPKVSFKEECLHWDDLSFYNQFSYTLSNRLHVLLLGVVHGVVPIGLLNEDVKTQKIIDIFSGVELKSLLFNSLDNNDIILLFNSKQELKELVHKVNMEQKEIIINKISELFLK
jgi:hypothetical protein